MFEVDPKMKKYIFGEKNSIHVIDLTQTVNFLNALIALHKTISVEEKFNSFRKKQASEQVSELAKQINSMLITDG